MRSCERRISPITHDYQMKLEPITIKDIAKALDLSIATVSRALRDSYKISSETKQRVLD